MKKIDKIVVLIICLGAVFGLALCLSACNTDSIETIKTDNDVSLGYINAKDCEDGNIHEDKVKSDMQFELGNTYYMVIDFTMQADRDSSGTDKLHTKLEITPASAIDATIQDAATSDIKEEVIDGNINISLSYKIPESANNAKHMRIIVQLRPIRSSDTKIKLSFESENNLNAVKKNSLYDLIVGDYTQGLEYTKTLDGGYAVSKGTVESEEQIVIPTFKNDRYVTSIGNSAFQNCNSLTSITIPNSVTYIGNDPFENCSLLQCKEYNNGLYLGNDNNPYLLLVKAKDKDITSFEINGNTQFIHSGAFEDCSSLEYNEYSNGLYLGNDNNPYLVLVKAKNKDITTFEINSNTKFIHSRAFKDCSSLSSIIIPDSAKSIGYAAFQGCSLLKSITLPFVGAQLGSCLNTHLSYIFGVVPVSLTKVIITGSSNISDSAFKDCSSLTSITIPESITSISDSAFDGCYRLVEIYNLSSLNITKGSSDNGNVGFYALDIYTDLLQPSKLTTVNNFVVRTEGDNKTLIAYIGSSTEISIPDSVTYIGERAFKDCSTLTKITVPNSVTSICKTSFQGCSSLSSITLPFVGAQLDGSSNTHFGYIFGANEFLENKNCIPTSLGEVIITGGSKIDSSAFDNCTSLTNVTLPDSVTSIGEHAFKDCSTLTKITVPNSVTSVYKAAFQGCSSLSRITIPFVGAQPDGSSNTHFGYIFGADEFLENKNCIPASLGEVVITGGSSIDSSAFADCSSLTSITIPNSVTSIGRRAFIRCSSLTKITIPNSVTFIDEYAFQDCTSITSITIPDSVTSIGEYAFSFCESLTNIAIPDTVTTISNCAFADCSSLTSITIPNSVTSIGRLAFICCSSLTKITIPNSVTFIDEAAFQDCTSLTSVTIPDSVTSIGKYAFSLCKSLTNIAIGNNVKLIYEHAFWDCSSLTSITLPNSVIFIDSSAFSDCSSLTSITLPNIITFIGEYAFANCSSLTSITLPNSVTSIGEYAFQDCSSLTSITLPNSVTSIGEYAFQDCSSLTSITIFNSVTSIGRGALYGCSSLTNIDFKGTKKEWKSIDKDSKWHSHTKIKTVHCSDGDVKVYFSSL